MCFLSCLLNRNTALFKTENLVLVGPKWLGWLPADDAFYYLIGLNLASTMHFASSKRICYSRMVTIFDSLSSKHMSIFRSWTVGNFHFRVNKNLSYSHCLAWMSKSWGGTQLISPTAWDHESGVTHSLALIELLLRDWNLLQDGCARGLLVMELSVTRHVLCRNSWWSFAGTDLPRPEVFKN